jgi:uridine phosphorylase
MEDHHVYPILEFDPGSPAIIEPSRLLKPIDIAEACVLCFFQDVISALKNDGRLREVHLLGSEIGPNPVYELTFNERRLALLHPGVGAPLAGAFLDELIALGCRKFIACGGCGVLDGTIAVGHVVVPISAVRDEGISYHYLPPSREVAASTVAIDAIQATLERHDVPYLLGKTWTTDAVYRETQTRMARRRAEGCLTVEMEAAAFFAVAQFRSVVCGQLLYGGDDLSGEIWDGREWQRDASTREKLFWLAAEACLLL